MRDFVPKTPNFFNDLEPIVTRVLDQARTERELAESRIVAREHEARQRELEHEIAHRKRVEQALREAEEYLRLMVESVKDFAIFTVDPQGQDRELEPGRRAALRLFRTGDPAASTWRSSSRPRTAPEGFPSARSPQPSPRAAHPTSAGINARTAAASSPAAWLLRSSTKRIGCEVSPRSRATSPSASRPKKPSAKRRSGSKPSSTPPLTASSPSMNHGIVESMNPAAERIFGYTHDDIVGRNITTLMSEPERHEHDHHLQEYLRTGRQKVIGTIREVRGRKADGSVFPMELAVSETRLGLRRIFTGIVRDITEFKKAIEALEDADQRKDQFLAMLAHELRNPLAPISNAVQIMQLEGPGGPNFRWSIEVIGDQIKHMTRMVDDLLDVSRITRGKVDLQKETIPLADVVELAVEASRPLIETTVIN